MRSTRRGFLCGSSAAMLILSRGQAFASNMPVVVTDYGARPDGSDSGPGFARALAELARRGGSQLVITPGVYTFAEESGVALRFEGLRDLEVEGRGATLLFRGSLRPFIFQKCHGVRVRDLTIDWAQPPFSQGDVVEVAANRKSAVVALDAATPISGQSRVGAIGEYDRASGLLALHGLDVYNAVLAVASVEKNIVRLEFKWPVSIRGGSTVVLRHDTFDAHAFTFHDCVNIRLDDVIVRAAPGMAFVGSRCENITLSRCEVAPKPGSGLLMSTNADGAHFGNCRGEILIDTCRFAAMGDDGVNVNTSYWRVVERSDPHTAVVARWRDAPFQADDIPMSGDLFEFASGATLESLGEARVQSASPADAAASRRETLHFVSDVPTRTAVGDYVINEAWSPKTIIRNCRFENNRARGVLAHKDTQIEGCSFLNQSAQGIILCPDAWWMEGPEVANVQIFGNAFDGVDRWGLGLGAIYIDAIVTGPDGKPRSSSGRPNHGISIRDNVFRNIEGPEVLIRATRTQN